MALKAVGNAIKNSPRAIRKKFKGDNHEVLDEDWYHSEDPVKTGVVFYCKYLGSMFVTKTHGPGSTEDAVKAIVQEAKYRTKKLQKVKLTVSSKLIRLEDLTQQIKLDEIPLYRVSYCTVDPYYDKVFCYISRNGETKKLECHAFLCGKKSKAEAITLTVAQAFNIAYEIWHNSKTQQQGPSKPSLTGATTNQSNLKPSKSVDLLDSEISLGVPLTEPIKTTSASVLPPTTANTQIIPQMKFELLPEDAGDKNPFRTARSVSPLASPSLPHRSPQTSETSSSLTVQTTLPKAKSLDHLAIEDELDLEFQQLAEARSNPHLLDIGEVDRSTISTDIKQYMLGDRSYEDLSRSKSHDDLLFL